MVFGTVSIIFDCFVEPRDISLDIRRTKPGYHVTMRGEAYWHGFVQLTFEGLTRTDVVVEMHPPTRVIAERTETTLDWLKGRLGSRLSVVP